MKGKLLLISLGVGLLVLAGFWAYVRLSPTDSARWNVDTSTAFAWPETELGRVVPLTGGAVLQLPAPPEILARLDAIAIATPRTTRLAGSADQGRVTWVTRSGFWGFPDYTTAQIKGERLYIYARLRFGKSDLGVNAVRLRSWQDQL